MSKSVIRIVFSVLISLLVLAGIYTSVLGAPLGAEKVGTHLVSGAKVNLDHYRLSVTGLTIGIPNGISNYQNGGHDCDSERQNYVPED